MIEQRVYTPTNYIEKTVVHSVIFLAGPIQGAVDWQSTAIELIKKENPHIIVANPRRRYLDGEFDYEAQVDWETFHLRRAGENGVIMFWLPKETDHDHNRAYAQTSRVELGEWKVRHERDGVDLVIGIEKGFSGERYIRRRFSQDCPGISIPDTLEQTCLATVSILDRNIINNPLPKKKT